jgi:serine/threonine protein phosphatase PrpC
LHIESGAGSNQGKVRTSNEDSFVADVGNKVFLVADGMGGHAAGEIASQIAAATVNEVFSEQHPDLSPDDLLRLAVQRANARIYDTQAAKPEFRGMGSTLTILAFSGSAYWVAQVGDSRAYLLRNGTLTQLTRDHSLIWPLFENGILAKEDISKHPQKNLITRSVGTYPQVEVDLYSDAACEGDVYLLCSDGLTDVMPDREIARVLSRPESPPQDLSETLIDSANAAGGPDNITVVVARLVPEIQG